jgi:hypothetical protein
MQGSPEAVAVSQDGALTWDVLDLLAWARSRQATSGSFVVVLKPVYRSGAVQVEVGAMEAGHGAVLSVTERPGCG